MLRDSDREDQEHMARVQASQRRGQWTRLVQKIDELRFRANVNRREPTEAEARDIRIDLSDEEWAVIEPLLPTGGRGPKRTDGRRILNGIFYILRTGAPWRDLPDRYGPRTTVYNRYARWARRGISWPIRSTGPGSTRIWRIVFPTRVGRPSRCAS